MNLPEWVRAGASFRQHNHVFHVRGIVDGHAVIREWRRSKRYWTYTVAEPEYFDAFKGAIVVRRALEAAE